MLSMSGIHFFPCWVSTKRCPTYRYSEFQWIMMDCVPSNMTIWCHLFDTIWGYIMIYLLFHGAMCFKVCCPHLWECIDHHRFSGFPGGALIQPCGVRVCTKSSWDLHRYRVACGNCNGKTTETKKGDPITVILRNWWANRLVNGNVFPTFESARVPTWKV